MISTSLRVCVCVYVYIFIHIYMCVCEPPLTKVEVRGVDALDFLARLLLNHVETRPQLCNGKDIKVCVCDGPRHVSPVDGIVEHQVPPVCVWCVCVW